MKNEMAIIIESTQLDKIAHDLRTVLNGMLGYVQVLLDDESLSESQRRLIEKVKKCNHQLEQEIERLVIAGRPKSGENEDSIDLCDTTEDTYTQITGYQGQRQTILIIDDDPESGEIVQRLLQARGFTVLTVETGTSAIALLKTIKPDLIFIDLDLPGMDGFEIVRKIRESTSSPRIKLVALSGYPFAGIRKQMERSGFDGYLKKPVHLNKLLMTLETHLQLTWIYLEDSEKENKSAPNCGNLKELVRLIPEPIYSDILFECQRGSFKKVLGLNERLKEDPRLTEMTAQFEKWVRSFDLHKIAACLEKDANDAK